MTWLRKMKRKVHKKIKQTNTKGAALVAHFISQMLISSSNAAGICGLHFVKEEDRNQKWGGKYLGHSVLRDLNNSFWMRV